MEILRYAEKMRDDLLMVVLTHTENAGDNLNPKYVIKTVGKMLTEKVTLEGLFTYIFFCKIIEETDGTYRYKFLTNTDGEAMAKTPMGMFPDKLIDNDLAEAIKVINEYNNGD